MSKVMHSWTCMAHGEFMGYSGDCPHGCSSGMVRKLMGASIVTNGKSKFIDKKTADLARQFGETEFNNKYDKSRIDMTQTDDIQKKRMMGQTYSVPLDPKTGVSGYLGETGGSDPALAGRLKESANQAVKNTLIVKDDHATLPAG